MPIVTWDHVHLRSPDPEATAVWLENVLGGVIIRGPGRIDVKLGGANVFIAPVTAGDGVNAPPQTPYQGLDHFGFHRLMHRGGTAQSAVAVVLWRGSFGAVQQAICVRRLLMA